jgi:hypothetical protein
MKNPKKALTITALLASCALTAFGDSLRMNTSTSSNGTSGGAYTVTVLSGPASNSSYSPLAILAGSPANSFESFCLEPTEHFSAGSTYDYTIASYAFGGNNEELSRDVGPGDQLSIGTAWLYSQFAQGILSGYNYGTALQRQASNLQLQRAFWYLEDDFSTYNTTAFALTNPFLSLVATNFGGSANALTLEAARANASAGQFGVYALNLTSGTVQNQSQLYYHSVPEQGATLAYVGLALLGLAVVRRRFVG